MRKKSFSTKRVVVSTETDITSGNGRLEGLLTTTSPYYDNKDLVDFLSLNTSKVQKPTVVDTITFTNVKLVKTPSTLSTVVSSGIVIPNNGSYDIKVYINGTRYYFTTHFTVSIAMSSFTINFNSANLGFNVDSGDEVTITGKFIHIV